MKARVGDEAKIVWLDIRHEDDLTLDEVKKLEPAKSISYGKLLVQNDDWITIVGTEFPDENGNEYRGIICIPKSVVSRIIKLKEVKNEII